MSVFPPALLRLIRNLGNLPGIGEKTATRLALAILRWPDVRAKELAQSIDEVKKKIRFCSTCSSFTETDPCAICADPKRATDAICVVEDPGDMMAIEKSGGFKGRYHVLHGVLSPMDGIGPDELKIKELLLRIKSDQVKEVILATSPTVAGEATAAYLAGLLQNEDVTVTRIACGVPMGTDLKYNDEMTLRRALEARTGA
ncbi:MAG: recombination mediator RecR [Thermodesulfobacteriota bacterium]